jgi:hypothetical protein
LQRGRASPRGDHQQQRHRQHRRRAAAAPLVDRALPRLRHRRQQRARDHAGAGAADRAPDGIGGERGRTRRPPTGVGGVHVGACGELEGPRAHRTRDRPVERDAERVGRLRGVQEHGRDGAITAPAGARMEHRPERRDDDPGGRRQRVGTQTQQPGPGDRHAAAQHGDRALGRSPHQRLQPLEGGGACVEQLAGRRNLGQGRGPASAARASASASVASVATLSSSAVSAAVRIRCSIASPSASSACTLRCAVHAGARKTTEASAKSAAMPGCQRPRADTASPRRAP